MKTVLTVLGIVALFPAIWLPAQPVRRALIMGNDAYPGHPLHNARNDAEAIDKKLRSFGYKSTLVLNADRKTLTGRIDAFAESLSPGDLAFVYYAGHGLQVGGENYLVPVDFRITHETEVKNQGYSLSAILSKLSEHGATTQVVVLDACRDNPFLSSRSIQNGWAGVATSAGSFVAFGTAPGSTASDAPGEGHGRFTESLLLFIDAPLGIEAMFQKVREDVIQKSLGQQIPWTASSLIGSLHIDPKEDASAPATGVALMSTLRNQTKRSAVDISESLRGIPVNLPGEDEVTLLTQADQEMRSLHFAYAIPILQHILQIDPVCALALRLLGIAFQLVGRSTEAQSTFNRAIALNSNDGVAYASLCLSKISESPSEAQMDCRRAVRLSPNLPQAHVGLAIGLAAEGSRRLAYDEATLAIKLNPSSPLGYRIRGDIANSLGDPESAQQDYSKADKLSFANRATPAIQALELPQVGSAITPSVASGGPPAGAAPGVTPASFNGYSDAKQIANGCTATTTGTTIVCPSAPFVSGDVGKELWVTGAGASGVAFGSTISTVVSNTTVTVAATPSTAVTQNQAVFGHDDAAALQACFNYSSLHGVQCILGTATPNLFLTPAGYLVASAGLTIPTHANIAGNSFYGATTIFAEYNGDLLSLPTGTSSLAVGQPVSGVNFANLELYFDPSQPNGRGIHLNAANGLYNEGGMYYSTFSNISVENAAQECIWFDGGVAGTNLPNQYITLNQFVCNFPNQMHSTAAIRVTGQNAQVIFQNGAINGVPTHTFEPNPMISFLGNGGNYPADFKFFGYTCEVATSCLYAGPNTTNIHYDSGYMEQVDSPLIADTTQGLTFNGNHMANSGNVTAVGQFLGGTTASMRDTYVYGTTIPAAFAVCTGTTNTIDFEANQSSVTTTTNCATSTTSPSTSTLNVLGGSSVSVAANSTPMTTISAPGINAGKTLTLYASGAFKLATGGNINLGGFSSPLTVLSGNSVTLTLLDQTATWLVTGTTPSAGGVTGTTALGTSSIASGACQAVSAGSVNSSAATGATTASKILWTPAASLQSVTGYQVSTSGALSIDAYPTSGYVNFNVCNWTAGSITPRALTLNWELLR
jgi:tetratricopeptide (TPR) repeat protein